MAGVYCFFVFGLSVLVLYWLRYLPIGDGTGPGTAMLIQSAGNKANGSPWSQ